MAGLKPRIYKELLPRATVLHFTGGSHSHSSLIESQQVPVKMFPLHVHNTAALLLKTTAKKDSTPKAKWTTCMNG